MMVAADEPITLPIRIRELRRDPARLPGGAKFLEAVMGFAPMVNGIATALIPENEEAVEKVVLSVVEAFMARCRKLRRRTLIASWLARTTIFAARNERKRLRLPNPPKESTAGAYQLLFKNVSRCVKRNFDLLTHRFLLRQTLEETAKAARIRPRRAERKINAKIRRFKKALRKTGRDPVELFDSIPVAVPPNVQLSIERFLSDWAGPKPIGESARAILRAWFWHNFGRRLSRFARIFAVIIVLLASTIGTFAWMAQHGFLTEWFIRNGAKQALKEFPDLAKPAQPLQANASPALRNDPPKTASELYSLTNIWPATLRISAAEWKKIHPSRVEPIRNLMGGGRINLRNPNSKRNGLAGALGIEFNYVHGELEFAGRAFTNIAVRYRGNGTYLNSLYGPKQSFKVELDKFEKKQHVAKISTLNFINSVPDDSYLHDALGEQLFRDLGVIAPRTAYSYLTLDVPEKFTNQALGIYVLIENIDSNFAADRFRSKKTAIFKPVTYDLFKYLGDDWKDYAGIYDLKTKPGPEATERVIDFAKIVTNADDAEFARRMPEFVEIEEYAAFVAGHVLLSSYDGYLANGQNYYMYLDPKSNKFGFISWDQDHAWGEFGYVGNAEKREQASIWNPASYSNRFLDRAMKVEKFRRAYRAKLEFGLANLFTTNRLYAQIDSIVPLIRPAVAADNPFRLQRFDKAVSKEWLKGPRDGIPEGPKSVIHQIKRFIANRAKSVREQLDGKSEGYALKRN